VFEWLKRFRKVARQLSVAARAEEKTARNTKAINLKPYTPEPKAFLGQLAYIHPTPPVWIGMRSSLRFI